MGQELGKFEREPILGVPEALREAFETRFRLLRGHDCMRSHLYRIDIRAVVAQCLSPRVAEQCDVNIHSLTHRIGITHSPGYILCDSDLPGIADHLVVCPGLKDFNCAVEE
ncbi:hypothetical protein TNCV_1299321 [Trichonephila clavipes]|nr:hypothetical protein TNCV_1299321 [Trichonephila clavipes]